MRREKITEALAIVGYKKDIRIRPAMLSMGEQKLIAFARAMLCDPVLLFLDEWTESLDDDAAMRLIRLVKLRKEKDHTIIFVSHNISVIKMLADYVVVIKDGNVMTAVSKEQIEENDNIAQFVEKEIT
jgi:ABC-type multidrug transport system ATPase subunit